MKLSYKRVNQCKENPWLVYRVGTEQHTHLKSKGSCLTLIRLINQGILPKSSYLRESAKRLLTDKEYEKLNNKTKQRYVNVNKGHRRVI